MKLNRRVNAPCWFRRRWLGNISRQSYSLQQYAPSRQLSRRSLCRPATNTEIARRPTRPREIPHPCYFTAASARSSVAREGSPIPQPAAGNSRLLHTFLSSLAERAGAGRRPKPADCAHGAPGELWGQAEQRCPSRRVVAVERLARVTDAGPGPPLKDKGPERLTGGQGRLPLADSPP